LALNSYFLILVEGKSHPPRILVTTSSHIISRFVPVAVLAEKPIKPLTMTQQSKVQTERHERSLRETNKAKDNVNECEKTCKSKMMKNEAMNENSIEGVHKEASGKKPTKQATMNQQSNTS
jgi:hypothetical protein